MKSASYRCSDVNAVHVPVEEIIAPFGRKLNEQALRKVLAGIREDAAIDPVVVFHEPGASRTFLLDGMHRWRVSVNLQYLVIPCRFVTREEAEVSYGYSA
jgi:ParB-like chromosome segregation protein Spo0J